MKSVSFAEGEQSTPDFPNLVGSYRFSSIRAELDTGVERVILKAEGDGDLQWQAQWVSEATTQGKGDVIDVAGKSILQVMVAGVRYPEEGEDEELLAALPTTKLITDIQAEPVFEGMQQIVIGTKEEVPYRVYFDEQTGYLLIEFQS